MNNYPQHIVAVGALVRNSHDQILLVKTERRGWELPGGQVEQGEDITSALEREIKEESGVKIKVEKLAAVYSSVSTPTKVILDFSAVYDGDIGKIETTNEILDARFFDRDEVLLNIQNEIMKYRIEWLLKNDDSNRIATYSKNPFAVISEIVLKSKSVA
jgi:8-oxo-dGTP diphosphatase